MHSFSKAIKIAIATALGGITMITQAEFAASQEHHSSPTSATTQEQERPKTPDEDQDEVIEEEIEHFEPPTLTPRERAVEQVLNQGLEKLNKKNYEGALQDFNQVLSMDSSHETAYRLRGDLLRKLEDYRGSVNDYSQSIKLNPLYWSTYVNRGEVYEIVGNYHKAIEDYNKAIELYPEDGVGYTHRGAVYAKLGNNQEAMVDFNKAINFNPNRPEAYLNRGNLHAKLGHIKTYSEEDQEAATLYKKALADYQQAVKLFGEQGLIADSQKAMDTMQKLQQRLARTTSIQ